MTDERLARLGDTEIAYQEFGNPADPLLLLIMGLGVQMLGWDERFCGMLVERGFHVVRFDNRDVGHSTHFGGGPPPDVMAAAAGDLAAKSARPLTTSALTPEYRREMIRVFTKRAVLAAAELQ